MSSFTPFSFCATYCTLSNLIQGLLQEYDIQSADGIQEVLKDLLSGTIRDMLETEMDNHLGYGRYERL